MAQGAWCTFPCSGAGRSDWYLFAVGVDGANFLGGVLSYGVERAHKVRRGDEAERDRLHRPGVLFSAGLITGEALMGF